MCGYPTGDSCTRIGADAGCRTASIVFGCIGNAKRCAPLRRANPADSGPGTDPAHRGSLGFHSTPVNRAGGFTPAAGRRGRGPAGHFTFGIGMPTWSAFGPAWRATLPGVVE